MRIHKLEMNEFLSFKGTTTIDFDDIAQDSLFMLFGETGAGKTSILDAISYALYGETSRIGKRKGLDNLRCQTSEEANPTSVKLEISIAGQRYLVTRTLAQTRTIGQNVRTSLVIAVAQGENWVVPESLTKVNEGEAFLESKIGLDSNQFFQVVMLPQGKFEKFLASSTNEREPILIKLFRADRFTNLEAWFKRESSELRRILDTADNALRFIAGQIDQSVTYEVEINTLNFDWLANQLRLAADEVKEKQILVNQQQVNEEACRARVQEHVRKKEQQETYANLRAAFSAAEKNLQDFVVYLGEHEIKFDSVDTNSAIQLAHTMNDWQDRITELTQTLQGDVRAKDLQTSISDLGELLRQLIENLTPLQEELDKANNTLSEGTIAAGKLGASIEARNQASHLLEALNNLKGLESVLNDAQGELKSALNQQKNAKAEFEDISLAREKSIAAELAEALKDGQACVVCGSIDHPSPASRIESHVDKSELEAARLKKGNADTSVAAKKTNIDNLTSQIEGVRNLLGEKVTLSIEQAEIDLEAAKKAEQELQNKVDAANAIDVPEIQAKKDALEERIAEVKRDIDLHKQELSQISKIEDSAALTLELEEIQAKSSKAEEEQWANKLAQLVSQRDSAKSALSSNEVVEYSAEEHALAGEALAAAVAGLDEAQRALTTASNRELLIQDKSESYKDELKAYQEAESKFSIVENLSGIINGTPKNSEVRAVSLQSYYLSTRFDQVLQYANVRLAKMSGNQFVLVRGEREGGRQSYLDINIYDAWTGRKRPTYGISGGETFMVSLSLALGLADAVINSAGVAPFESLFIDEGFGSLGPATLDSVMETLFDLQAGDRAIGVISHVAAMAERIPRQIHVKKENGVSSASFHYSGT